ncbi:hypothetical protein ORFV000117 [Orf virus]|nr:hypothetical protein ORFV000117 [Orf virus]
MSASLRSPIVIQFWRLLVVEKFSLRFAFSTGPVDSYLNLHRLRFLQENGIRFLVRTGVSIVGTRPYVHLYLVRLRSER